MSNEKLNFADKVVIVTGAGGGLGKCYALAFAERGAKVVVNDLGGGISGDGKNSKAADIVVNEIRAKNGIAVANYDSVENGESIINTAIENFGRVDILVNNAGILRDKSVLKTSDLDWDLIHRIHLRAAFVLCRAAWPHMQKNKFGRIIMTSSAAGIYGNFGQANYSSAKLGLLGLSNTLSIEGRKYNIKCNTIAPVARSRLTQTVMPDEILDVLKAEFVSPLVLYLCHEDTEETGSLFEVGGGWIGKLRWEKSSGAIVKKDDVMTPEDVKEKWNEICSFENPIYHATIQESTNHCIESSSSGVVEATPQSIAPTTTKPDAKFTYDFKDAILYALSIGVSTTNETNLKFLYENHPDFSVMPSFGVIPAFGSLFSSLNSIDLPHNIKIDFTKLLHGEHYLELYKPFTSSGSLTVKTELVDVVDKGSGATLVINVELFNENQEKMALNQFVIFIVGSGNFGGKKDSEKQIKANTTKKFEREPDAVKEEKTSADQAALYRLTGDLNPMHIDPAISSVLGFERPILHGLCSFGFAVRHVLDAFCDSDVTCFKSVKVRFVKPVLPGQTIQTRMWLEKESDEFRVYFECKVLETQTVVIAGAYVTLTKITKAQKVTETVAEKVVGEDFASEKIFKELSLKLSEKPDIAKTTKAIFAFLISKGDAKRLFLVDLKNENKIKCLDENEKYKADCTLIIKDEDFVLLSSGAGNPQQMFMKGKLKIKGNIMLAQKLEKLFKVNAKL